MISSLSALGIGAASFASEEKRSEQRYSGKPDGGAVSGDGTPREETKKFRISEFQKIFQEFMFFSNGVMLGDVVSRKKQIRVDTRRYEEQI